MRYLTVVSSWSQKAGGKGHGRIHTQKMSPQDLLPDISVTWMDKYPTFPGIAYGSHALEQKPQDLNLSVRLVHANTVNLWQSKGLNTHVPRPQQRREVKIPLCPHPLHEAVLSS